VFAVHGEASASVEFAHLVHEKFGLKTYVPGWRETLFLKPKEFAVEVSRAAEEKSTLGTDILKVHAGVLTELEKLKWRIQRAENHEKITEDELDRLRYIQEELQQILSA
jgi:hypothetical protein